MNNNLIEMEKEKMKVIRFPDGKEKEILGENNRFYITKDAQYRKSHCADCTTEEKEKEAKPAPKKTAKKSKAKE